MTTEELVKNVVAAEKAWVKANNEVTWLKQALRDHLNRLGKYRVAVVIDDEVVVVEDHPGDNWDRHSVTLSHIDKV